MKRKIITASIIAAAALVGGSVLASSATSSTTHSKSRFTPSAYVGAGFTVNYAIEHRNAAVFTSLADSIGVGSYIERRDDNFGGKLFVGYQLKKRFALEFSVARLGNYRIDASAALPQAATCTLTNKHWLFVLDSVFKANLRGGLFGYAAVGGGYDHNDASVAGVAIGTHAGLSGFGFNTTATSRSDWQLVGHLGAGLGWKFAQNFGIRAGFDAYAVSTTRTPDTPPTTFSVNATYSF